MRKISFVALLMLICSAAFGQWSVGGNVQDVNSQPVNNKLVYVITDSFPAQQIYWGQDYTDSNGNYTVSFANGTPAVGTIVHIQLFDCNNILVDDTLTYTTPSITHNFTICAAQAAATDIHGTITAGNPTMGEADAQVYLIEMHIDSLTMDTTLVAIDSTVTDSVGYYSFAIPNFYAPELMVKAALLPANANYANYLPTYYTSSLMWYGASALPNPLPLTATNLQLIAGVNPGGPGFIGGDVAQGANKSTAVGDPLEHRILILTTTNNQAVAYAYSDASGHFSFSNLPLGSYKLFGDVMNKSNPALLVTLDNTHQSVTNIEFQEHSHLFEGHYIVATSVGNMPAALQSASVFPNPASDKISVTGIANIGGAKTATLTSMSGAVIYTHLFAEGEAVTIPVSSLSKGVYMLNLNTKEGNAIFKVTK